MISTRYIARATAVVSIGLVHSTRASAQAPGRQRLGPTLAAEVAALQYVSRTYLTGQDPAIGPVGTRVLDARVGSPRNSRARGQAKRSDEALRWLAAAVGGRVDDGDRVLSCETATGKCHLPSNGTALIRLGQTVIHGDSARTAVTLLRTTVSPREPVSHMTWYLVLHSTPDGLWRVVPTATIMDAP